MIINRIYENQNLLSLQLVSFLVGLRTCQHAGILEIFACDARNRLLLLLLLLLLLSPLGSLFTIIYPKQTMSLRCIQCCSCSVFTVCATCNVISPVKYVLYFYISTSHSMCAVPNTAVFWQFLIFAPSLYVTQVFFSVFLSLVQLYLLLCFLKYYYHRHNNHHHYYNDFCWTQFHYLKFKHSKIIDFHFSNKKIKMESVFSPPSPPQYYKI